ncbi:hypothetical protein DY000_02031795 [Brassica cretica]|uniref:Uncharacterized protein n=1 Tax=Brassica cretica TaxID=69181 RepID=A0ABQ7DTM0_BRACR|nr:hypothetical protein DY000_02031795 [Brassica cretica]
MIKSLVVKSPVLEEDKVLDMEECKAIFLENGIDMDAVDNLQDFSEGEFEEMLKEQEGAKAIKEDVELGHIEEDKEAVEEEAVEEEAVTTQGPRKRLFKPSTAGSTKMRIAAVLVSPRKRVHAKIGTRHRESGKQQEKKGTSNPKNGMQKP